MRTYDLKGEGHIDSTVLEASCQGILDLLPMAAYACDAAGLITYFNAPVEAVWGRAPKLRDAADRYCGSFKLFFPDGTPMPHAECWVALALHHGRPYNGREVVIEQPDGGRVFGLAHAHPLRNGHGEVVGAVNLVVEATARKAWKAGRIPGLIAPASYDADLAMIEVGVSALTLVAGASFS